MRCPNCQNEVREGAVFCGSCGAAIPAAAAPVASAPPRPAAPAPAPQPAPVQPTAYTPAPSDAPATASGQAEYEQQMAEYQRKQAEYEQQRAAYEQYQQQAAGQTAQMPAAAPAVQYQQAGAYGQSATAPKKKTGLIIGIAVGAFVLIGALIVGGFFIAKGFVDDPAEEAGSGIEMPVETPETPEAPVEAPTAAGAATAEEAVKEALTAEGFGDWVQQLYKEDDASVVYWAGPPNSEWVSEITVVKGADGTWTLGAIEALQFGGDVAMTPAEEAVAVVTDFLVAVQQDRADDAHDLTIEPFSLDGASASYSNGEFTAFEIGTVEEQSDGTVWVETSETWYGSTATQWYYVVPTEAGYRISNLEVR